MTEPADHRKHCAVHTGGGCTRDCKGAVHWRNCAREACGKFFTQPAITGRPMDYCSHRCKLEVRRARQSKSQGERYRQLRAAGYDTVKSAWGATGKARTAALLREASAASGGKPPLQRTEPPPESPDPAEPGRT